jgi:hypothetical protein
MKLDKIKQFGDIIKKLMDVLVDIMTADDDMF